MRAAARANDTNTGSGSGSAAPKKLAAQGKKSSVRTEPGAAPSFPHAPGFVRIIGGQWKRTKLPVAVKPGLRPTPDRVRETLFNWLGADLSAWRCLDAFAGSGALGFEAASRGALAVTLVEQDSALVTQLTRLQTQLQATGVQVLRGDGIKALKSAAPASLDLIFIDPPFDAPLFQPALQAAAHAVAADGLIYLEAPTAWNAEQLALLGLALHKHLKAGAVHGHLLRRH